MPVPWSGSTPDVSTNITIMLHIKIITKQGTTEKFVYDGSSGLEPSEILQKYEDEVRGKGYDIHEIIITKSLSHNKC